MIAAPDSERAQSSIVGVALLIGVTMLALGTMAAAVGGVVSDAATDADVRGVTTDFQRAFQPAETTGLHRAHVQFGEGSITVEPRAVRIMNASGTVRRYDANAVVYSTDGGDRRVTFLVGAILVTQGDYTRVVRPPSVATGPGVLVVGLPVLHGAASIGGTRLDLTVETRVTHDRRTLGADEWRIAVETSAAEAWARALRRRGAASVTRTDFDGDGVPSIVATFDNTRTAHLVVHDVQLEVRL